jgi:hypothetical protein
MMAWNGQSTSSDEIPKPCCGRFDNCVDPVCIHHDRAKAARKEREAQAYADAIARQHGLNLDGSVRRETVDLNPKDVAGKAKPQLGLIPTGAMAPVAQAMANGLKYGPYNWRYKPIGHMAYLHALLRHIQAVIGGEDIDPESGAPHLAHVAATAMIVLDAKSVGTLKEDRPTVVEIKP